MICVLDADAGALGAVRDLLEGARQVAVRGVRGLLAVGARLGVRGGVGDRHGDELGVVAARDVDREVERAQRHRRAVPGEQYSLEHQCRIGTRDRATINATSM